MESHASLEQRSLTVEDLVDDRDSITPPSTVTTSNKVHSVSLARSCSAPKLRVMASSIAFGRRYPNLTKATIPSLPINNTKPLVQVTLSKSSSEQPLSSPSPPRLITQSHLPIMFPALPTLSPQPSTIQRHWPNQDVAVANSFVISNNTSNNTNDDAQNVAGAVWWQSAQQRVRVVDAELDTRTMNNIQLQQVIHQLTAKLERYRVCHSLEW